MLFYPTEQTRLGIFLNIIIILLVWWNLHKAINNPLWVKKKNRSFSILLFFIFCLFSVWGADWFHYQEIYPQLTAGYQGHMEPIYVWLAQNLTVDYLTFRIVIWWTGLILLLFTFHRLNIDKNLVLFFFGSIWLIWFSYARVSLPMAMVCCGVSLIVFPWKGLKRFSFIVGIALIFFAFYFHKSAVFIMLVAVLALASVRLSPRNFLILCVVSFPIVLYLLSGSMSDFMMQDFDEEGLGNNLSAGQKYMENQIQESGLGSRVLKMLERFPYYLISFLALSFEFKNRNIDKRMLVFSRLQVLIVLFSSLFLFDFGYNTGTVYTRFLRFGCIPNAIVLAYLWERSENRKLMRFTYVFAFIGALYALVYAFHCVK